MNKNVFKMAIVCCFSILISLTTSCSKDLVLKEPKTDFNEIKIINGKIAFASKEDLAIVINESKKEKRQVLEKSFEKLYDREFKSLKPIINKNNTRLLSKFSALKKKGINKQNLVGDKIFAAFINNESEIIVNDSLYLFTPRGLFFAQLKDSLKLRSVANNRNLLSKNNYILEPCELREQEPGVTEMEEGVNRYVAPLDEGEGCEGPSYTGEIPSGQIDSNLSLKAKNSDAGLNELIQNLEIINGGKSNWFQDIFGTYRYAHKYLLDNDYRFELDYWNQDWYIYASVGLEAETHKKGWFWWNNINSDEIVLGINKVKLKYTLPKPDLKFLNPNYNPSMPIYIHDGAFKIKTNNNVYNPISIKVNNNTRIPFFKIRDTDALNIYINDNIQYNVINDSNIKQLYQLGYNYLKERYGTSKGKNFFVTIQNDPNEITVFYFDEMGRAYNTDEVQKVFANDWSLMIGGKYADTGNDFSVNPIFTPATQYLGSYKYLNIDIFGVARRGLEWRGLRLILE